MTVNEIQVLLIDDDEDDFLITREFLEDSPNIKFNLDWTSDYHAALDAIQREDYEVYLVDLHLGHWNGFDLIKRAIAMGCRKPLILLTGAGEREIDQQALELGAADYLVKGQFNSQMLERAILYAIRHWNTLDELRLSETKARAVLETQTEFICRFKIDTSLTFVNSAYASYFDKSPDELIGQKWISLVPEDQHIGIIKHVTDVALGKEPVTYEHEVLTPRGEIRWQQWTDKPILDEDGHVIELQSVGIDITERKRAEKSLRDALEKERELNELKSRFVSMASHEFRTPLTTILSVASFLEMAEEQISSEKRISRLQKIQIAANEMTELLNDVLLFGKAEANRLDYQPKEIDIVTFSREIVEDILAASGREHHIQFIDQTCQSTAMLDDKLMRQVMTNLVSNAIKYSPKGSNIRIEILCDEQRLTITVCDQGIGIPEKDQQHLFEPFHRAKNVRDISGTGLGLAITKKAIDLHKGSITFKSKPNQGTCFTVRIPQSIG